MSDTAPAGGLSTISEVEALADQLTACADALHARVVADIKAHTGGFSAAEQAVLRTLYDDEQLLRQRANSLYNDAAKAVVANLGASQQQLLALTAAAAEKIRKIALVGDTIGLLGGLLSLAGSAASGNIGGVLKALDEVRTRAAGVAAHQPSPAPAAPAAPAP